MDLPPGGINRLALPALPSIKDFNPKFFEREVFTFSIGEDDGPTRIGIDLSVSVSNLIEHQFHSLIQLDAEPVPSNLVFPELAGNNIMVHPAHSLNRKFFSF